MSKLALEYGLSFADLYGRDGLIRLDREFVAHLAVGDVALHDRLMAGRADPEALDHKAESDLLVDLAPHVEDFLGALFGIGAAMRASQARQDALAPLFSVKRLFVQRRAVKEIKEADAAALDGAALAAEIEALVGGVARGLDTRADAIAWETRFAERVSTWLDDETANAAAIMAAARYAA